MITRYDINDISETEKYRRACELDALTIFRSEVGSTAHGVTHATNDIDEIAVYVPSIEEVVNFSTNGAAREETFIFRPGRGTHDPSAPKDLDRTYHSLEKFVRLMASGNPSILFALFGTNQVVVGDLGQQLLALRGMFRTGRTRDAYLGYMDRQRERITGERGAAGRMRRSPEGGGEIDWKYAMHMCRLGVQAVEYLMNGEISAPSLERDKLMAVRDGKMSIEEVLEWADRQRIMVAGIPLYEHSDEGYLSAIVAQMHAQHWEMTIRESRYAQKRSDNLRQWVGHNSLQQNDSD